MENYTVEIYNHPNGEMKSFLLPEPILPPLVLQFKNPLPELSNNVLKDLGSIGERIVLEIIDIQGVDYIRVKPKEIQVRKMVSTSWDEIEGKIRNIIESAVRRSRMKRVK